MTTRESFVHHFDEEEACVVEAAAIEHSNGINNINKGSDEFRWAISICIGYECFKLPEYRNAHGFNYDAEAIQAWIRMHCNLGNHDGDVDYLALFCGTYQDYIQ